jgi:hypothetical integral membrane protein (TIGR02206 family)
MKISPPILTPPLESVIIFPTNESEDITVDFSHFCYSSDSIPEGLGFSHFSPLHFFWLALCAALAVFCCLLYRKLQVKGRTRMRLILTTLVVGDEIWKIAWLTALGLFTHSYLPFHLCSVNIFLILFFTVKPTKTVGNFLYGICIPAALAALLFPTWTKLPFWNFMHLHSFSVHVLLFVIPLMLTVGGDIKPDVKQIPKCLLLLMCMALIAKGANLLWHTNFMFLESASEGNPLYFFEQKFGNHLIGLPVLAVAVLAVMYGPLTVWQRCRGRKRKTV